VAGVLVLAMSVDEISRIFAHWKTGRTGFAFLTDEQSKVMAHPREEYVSGMVQLAEHPLVAAYRKDPQPHLLSFPQVDAKEALGYVQGNRWGWIVAVQREQDELFEPLRQTVYLGIGLLAAVALLVALATRAVSGMLVRPIQKMSEAADRMSLGHLEDPVPVQSITELATLGRSLDRLRISLRAAMSRLRT
jgi:methyl-accepting chemotaxis protein